MGDRAVYCARLESVCAERHPGFESPPIRHAFCLRLTSRWRRDALRVFCALLLFTVFVPVASAETALEISSLLEKAKGNFGQGNFDAALAQLDLIDKAKGQNSESLDLRGDIYFEQGKLDEAKKAFRAASAADPQRFPPRLHLADVLLREKAFYDAREIYSDLMEKTEIQSYNEKLRYAVLLTYLFEHNEARRKLPWSESRFRPNRLHITMRRPLGSSRMVVAMRGKNGRKPPVGCLTLKRAPGSRALFIILVGPRKNQPQQYHKVATKRCSSSLYTPYRCPGTMLDAGEKPPLWFRFASLDSRLQHDSHKKIFGF